MKRNGNPSTPDAVSLLLRRIESGRFLPGERIFPKDIAQAMGGSPIPVREALCQLVGRGIVVEQRNKGFSIAPMNSATLRALYAAHARLMEATLERWNQDDPLPGRLNNPWRTFAAIVGQVDRNVLMGMQSYLAGRLMIARKFEKMWFAAKDADYHIGETIRRGNFETATRSIREFHHECEISSESIWHLISDR